MESNWITKQLGSVNYFPDEVTANRFAAKARTMLLLTVDVTVGKDPATGNWMVAQSLKYITTEGEEHYALPVVQQPTE